MSSAERCQQKLCAGGVGGSMIQYHEIDTSKWASNGRMLPNIEVLFPRIDDNVISVGRCFRLEPHIILDNEELVFIAYVLTIDGNDKAIGMCLTRTENKWVHVDAIPDNMLFRVRQAIQRYELVTLFPNDEFSYSDERYYILESLT